MRDFGSRHTLRPLRRSGAARLGLAACGGTLLLTLATPPAAAQQYISADRNVIVDYSALDRLGPGPAATPAALGAMQGYPYGYMPSPAYGYQPSAAPASAPQSMLFVPKPFVPGPIAPIKPAGSGGTTRVASAPTPPPAPSSAPEPLPPLVPSTASAAPAAPAPEPVPEAPAETAAATPEAPAVPVPPEPPAETPETITPTPPEPEVSTNMAPSPPPEAPAAEAPAEPAETEAAEALPEPSEAETPSAPAESEAAPAETEAPAATSETETPAASDAGTETSSEETSEPAQDESTASQTAALPPAPAGDTVQIVFAGESAELPADILPKLDALADKLLQDENLRLQLMAYASGTEDTASKARRISLSRALAVRAYLIGKGIRSTRMDVRALGNKVEGEPADRVDIVAQTP